MPDFDLTGELSLKIELHMLSPIAEKVHSGNGPVSLVSSTVLYEIYVAGQRNLDEHATTTYLKS